MRFHYPALALLSALTTTSAVEAPIPPVPDKQPQPPFAATAKVMPVMLVPGFTVRELPIKLTSINNIEYAPDGRLFAAGYDGRFHLLRDTDGDGLEDKVDTFQPESSSNYALGMIVQNGDPCAVLTDEIVRFHDSDGDGIPDKRETIFKGFDDQKLVEAPYLNHRRVDSSMSLAYGPDGAWYVTMGNAGYNNPYWHEGFAKKKGQTGTAHYSTDQRRGCLLRITSDGKVEHLNSGLRYIMSLQFNKSGDLFASEQEGATWCPNGNPFDELLHLQPGRHYGFPPSHPKFLPNVVDEPSTWDYSPQHQSACGFRFNTASDGRGRFGPEFWADNAIVTGESRGILWRTALAKTVAGYVARTELFARINLLTIDTAISPKGDLLICCHTGKPDWGNGPQGEGRLFKISHTDKNAAQPVLTWAADETTTVVAFDRPLNATVAAKVQIEAGRYLAAGQRFETMRPPYNVVKLQQHQATSTIPVKGAHLSPDKRNLIIESAPRRLALVHTLSVDDAKAKPLDLAYDLSGLIAEWTGGTETWHGWLPHPDFIAAHEFTKSSATHDVLWKHIGNPGTLTLTTQLNLWNMLQPATQPLSSLDYTPAPETVTLHFKSDSSLKIEATGATVEHISDNESRLTVKAPVPDQWQRITITLATPATKLDVSYGTKRDDKIRPLGTRRFLLPFARPAAPDKVETSVPELVGGDWQKGRALFNGKATCFTCHQLRGEGFAVGADLNNLVHRDYPSVLRDISDPNAIINPDAVGYVVTMKDGTKVTGTRVSDKPDEIHIAQPGGLISKLKKSDIQDTTPMTVSLMPPGLDKLLSKEELCDLMSYLLLEKPAPAPTPITEKK